MKRAIWLAAVSAATLTVSLSQASSADLDPAKPDHAKADCSPYVRVAVSVAIDTSEAAVLHHSRFYQANRLRSGLGPHHYAIYYDPDRKCPEKPAKKHGRKKKR